MGVIMYEKNLIHHENLNELKLLCGNSKIFYHKINVNSPILPFITDYRNQTHFDRGFESILGEFSRIYLNKSFNKDFKFDTISKNILNEVIISKDESDDYLKLIIDEYLLKDDGDINIIHPYLFLYIPKTEGRRSNNETEIARFMRDVFFKDTDVFNDFLDTNGANNVILKIILNNLPELIDKDVPSKYISCLPFIGDVFREDMEFIKENYDFLVKNLGDIFSFYYFYYCSQLVLKLNQPFENVTNDSPLETYYLLDWEKASKSRNTIKNGYNLIKGANVYLFHNLNLIEEINTLSGTQGLFINQISDLINNGEIDKEQVVFCLKEWIKYYEETHNLNNYYDSDEFLELASLLKKDLKEGVRFQQSVSFERNLNTIAKKFFVKSRGQYGLVLNIDKKFLYLITAMCIKKDKIKLNDLFKEYERRGLFFDRYSKEKIVELLNTWNLIDKKSDSGDAQYVKSIL